MEDKTLPKRTRKRKRKRHTTAPEATLRNTHTTTDVSLAQLEAGREIYVRLSAKFFRAAFDFLELILDYENDFYCDKESLKKFLETGYGVNLQHPDDWSEETWLAKGKARIAHIEALLFQRHNPELFDTPRGKALLRKHVAEAEETPMFRDDIDPHEKIALLILGLFCDPLLEDFAETYDAMDTYELKKTYYQFTGQLYTPIRLKNLSRS